MEAQVRMRVSWSKGSALYRPGADSRWTTTFRVKTNPTLTLARAGSFPFSTHCPSSISSSHPLVLLDLTSFPSACPPASFHCLRFIVRSFSSITVDQSFLHPSASSVSQRLSATAYAPCILIDTEITLSYTAWSRVNNLYKSHFQEHTPIHLSAAQDQSFTDVCHTPTFLSSEPALQSSLYEHAI